MSYKGRFNASIPNEHRRTVAGMIAALDEAVGNVTDALVEAPAPPHALGLRQTRSRAWDMASAPRASRHPACRRRA